MSRNETLTTVNLISGKLVVIHKDKSKTQTNASEATEAECEIRMKRMRRSDAGSCRQNAWKAGRMLEKVMEDQKLESETSETPSSVKRQSPG